MALPRAAELAIKALCWTLVTLSLTYTFFTSLTKSFLPPPLPFISPQTSLTLSPTSTFTLAIFSDLHFGEEESSWGIVQDSNSTRVMRRVLASERQNLDLVVLNGDLITGENTFRENSSDYVHSIVTPMVEARVPWASTYGNHDSKFNLSRQRILEVEKGYELSYTRNMGGKGVTNYYLLIHRSGLQEKDSGKPVAVLWFFDSRGGGTYQDPDYVRDKDDIPNWAAPETTAWFRGEAKELRERYGSVMPGVAFVHIPPSVFLSVQRKGMDKSHFPGLNEDVPVSIQGTGTEDGDLVSALQEEWEEGGLHSVYVGHDHGNAWCGTWPEEGGKGPFLCFGKHTGYGGYGKWNRGARIVRLRFVNSNGDGDFGEPGEMEVDTWVRMEDGGVVSRVGLNETYGRDRYPSEDGE